jgi:hypothetical protein
MKLFPPLAPPGTDTGGQVRLIPALVEPQEPVSLALQPLQGLGGRGLSIGRLPKADRCAQAERLPHLFFFL